MMTSLYVIFGLAPQAPTQFKILATSMYQTMCNVHTRYRLLRLCIVTLNFTSGCLQHCKGAKYTLHCFQSNFFFWYGSMEWNMEETFSMEWKKIASMEYGKIVFHSIPYHALLIKDTRKRAKKNMQGHKTSGIIFEAQKC